MTAVFAAVFHPKWSQYEQLDHSSRMLRMRSAIAQAYTAMSGAAARMTELNAFYIFVAPEYWFTKAVGGNPKKYTLHSEDEKNEICNTLRKLSGEHKRYLLAPGTIVWRRPRSGLPDTRTHEGWNTAPIFYEGKLKHEYDKIYDDGVFRDLTDDVVFRSGTKTQLFAVEKWNFGIEVCGDFNDGNLSKEAAPRSLDFELMLSGTNFHQFNEQNIGKVPVKDGGYFIHADTTNMLYNGAWCVQRGSGAHGTHLPAFSTCYDPWTGKYIGDDMLGRALGVGRVLAVHQNASPTATGALPSLGQYSQEFQGKWPPAPQQPQHQAPQQAQQQAEQFRLHLGLTPVAPFLNSVTGNYTVRATATVTSVASNNGLPNQFVRFQAANGMMAKPQSGLWSTDGQGMAHTDITGNAQPLRISASCHAATVTLDLSLETASAGHVSKIGPLQGTGESEISAYYLPI
jgi:hypothetical protein